MASFYFFVRLHLDGGAIYQEWQGMWVKWEKQTGMDIINYDVDDRYGSNIQVGLTVAVIQKP